MTRNARLKKVHGAEYRYGEYIANRLHVADNNLAVIRACRKALGGRKRKPANFTRGMRDARHALYLGAMAAHKANVDMYRHYRF